MTSLAGCRKQLKEERFAAAEKAEETAKLAKGDATDAMVKAMKGFDARLDRVQKYRDELEVWSAIAAGATNDARKALEALDDLIYDLEEVEDE